ncbi:MAG: ABC-F family ATP-binding cassette domain-containing protein, partial [Planctomycetota bacterium]|nr:ABC-F family ATP-binding cassette domain-containing protein [Planctomycetota bacterium]
YNAPHSAGASRGGQDPLTMSLIVAEGICKSWSDKDVLRNVCVTLAPEERVGLVGANGEGKTTLVRILAGLEPATEGTMQLKTDLRIGYLPQDPPALEGTSLKGAMLEVFASLHAIEAQLHELAHQFEGDSGKKQLARYGELLHQFEVDGGYTYRHAVEQVLTGLNFPHEVWDRPLTELSGGQRTRAYLARLLLQKPDVLLLDEPTNHLDYDTVEWLEEWLQHFPGAVVVVSHDRYFLDRATTRTWEIVDATLECYKGNYSAYLTQRAERYLERMRRWEAQQEYINDTEDFIRKHIAGQRSNEAKGRRTLLARFMKTEAIPRPRDRARIAVRFKADGRTGDFVLTLKELQAGYEKGKPLVTVESLDVQRGQRVAIVGPNGCGKTTLVRTALGQLRPLGGMVKLGANVRVGYLSQTHAELSTDLTAVAAVRQVDPSIKEERARGLLGSLLLGEEDAFKKIHQLSGGQRSRVVLARLMLQKANVLVMDEPTNHLDVHSQEVLQDVLSDFDGTILFVSHDRYLIQALATDIWAMHAGAIVALKGDWGRYVAWRDKQMEAQAALAGGGEAAKDARKDDYQRRRVDEKVRRKQANETREAQRRFEEVETLIHALEDKLKALTEGISQASTAGAMDRVTALGDDYAADHAKLRELYAEWERLAQTLEEA